MLRDQPEETMDMMVLEDYTIADLSDEAIQGYRNYHAAVRPGHVWEKLPKEEYLEKIGAVGRLKGESEFRPTAAGLLMFGEEYRIVRYFPEYFLDYREVLDSYGRKCLIRTISYCFLSLYSPANHISQGELWIFSYCPL